MLPLVAQLGSLVGILLASPIAARVGYKRTMQMMLVFSTLFTFIPYYAKNVTSLMAGFLFLGMPWGVFQVISPAYASEVASMQLRPILTTWNNLCWVLGQLLAAGITKGFETTSGSTSYKIPFAFQWVFSSLLLIAVSFAPESPYWYLKKGRVTNARRAIKKLVRKGDAGKTEEKLALMRHTVAEEARMNKVFLDANAPARGPIRKWLGKFELDCFKGVDRRRTETSSMAWVIQALCGSSLIGWAPKLFEAAGLGQSQALSINIALPTAGIVGTLCSWWLMRKVGRRSIYLWGLSVMAVLLGMCGAFHYLPTGGGWAAGAVLVVYTAVYDLTVGPVCYCVVSELPSIRLRTPTLAFARACYLVANLINYCLTPLMLGKENRSWDWGSRTGLLYAAVCALGFVYTYFRIPETSAMSARELDVLFQNKASARKFSSEAAASLSAVPVTDAKVETASTEVTSSVISKSSTDGRVQAKQVEIVTSPGSSSP
jgi:SP family general alpha glucoside:H+ symporter-like MFS transporter